MATYDKVLLLHNVEGILKPRMFANYLEEAMQNIQVTLDEFDVVHVSCGNMKHDECLETYLNAKRVEGRSDLTIVRYAYEITRFMLWANVSTREVTTEHVRAYLDSKHDKGLKDSTIEGLREVLNAYFSWLEHEKLIISNPVFNIAPLKCEEVVRPIFTMSDIEKIKRCCKSKRDLAIVCMFLSTGCRISEVVAMNKNDINFHNCECVVHGKGKKQRIVYIDDVARMTLMEYLDERSDDNDALFITARGKKRIAVKTIRWIFKKIEKECGVQNIHPHRFRRTMITKLLEHGMPIHEVSILAGHDKIDTTMEYYTASNAKIKSSYMKYSA